MARYYRRRYRTIVRAPKKKWASNIDTIQVGTSGSITQQYAQQSLAMNEVQSALPTPVIMKTGNFKVQGDYRVTTTSANGNAGVSLYIVFVPEGYSITDFASASGLISNHPEWIMAWKFIGANVNASTAVTNYDGFTFSSRLKRNLNSGDSVRLLCIAEGANISVVTINAMVQYWTCAN